MAKDWFCQDAPAFSHDDWVRIIGAKEIWFVETIEKHDSQWLYTLASTDHKDTRSVSEWQIANA